MRVSIALLTMLTSSAVARETTACCFTDWLCGRSATPYAVGYVPVAAPIYSSAYAPLVPTANVAAPTSYSSGYVPLTTSPYAASYPGLPASGLPAASTSVLRPAVEPAPVLSSGVYQSQRPAYFDNSSVYTGLPVTGNAPASYAAPLTSYQSVAPTNYVAGYAAAQPPTAAPGLPMGALPAAAVAPVYAEPPRGLARFHGSWIRTNYRTSYYNAPITYYRPVTSIDPVSGTTVTVQQPCTSYVQQVQRTPYQSLQFAQPALPAPAAGCQAEAPAGDCGSSPYAIAPSTYAPSTYAPSTYGPASGVSQAGAVGPSDLSAVPIPSTLPQGLQASPGYTPGLAPLTGAPATTAPWSAPPAAMPPAISPSGANDRAPVGQPRLENYPPANGGTSGSSSEGGTSGDATDSAPKSYWQLPNADDSTALIRPREQRYTTDSDPVSLSGGASLGGANAEPIAAPEDYVSPFRSRQLQLPAAASDSFEAPPLPTHSNSPLDGSSVANRRVVPVREAALLRTPSARTPAPIQRDSDWYPIQP
jgi:hypothetical protein